MDETAPMTAGCEPPPITLDRRKELVRLAETVADDLNPKVKPNERCFFRRAVEMFLDLNR